MNKQFLLLLSVLIILIVVTSATSTALGDPIRVLTPFGTPLKEAFVEVTKLDGEKISGVLDTEGKIAVRNVPHGIVRLKVISWKGVPVNYEVTVTVHNTTVVCPKIGRLVLSFCTLAGQSLNNVYLVVKYNDKTIISESVAGSVLLELPEEKYTIIATYAGKTYTQVVDIEGGHIKELRIKLPILIVLAGHPVDTQTLLLLIVIIALLLMAIVAIASMLCRIIYQRRIEKIVSPKR